MSQVNSGVCPDCGRGVGDWHKGDCPKRKDKIQGVTPEDVQRTNSGQQESEGYMVTIGTEKFGLRITGCVAFRDDDIQVTAEELASTVVDPSPLDLDFIDDATGQGRR